ncbi:CAP domain-containing protein [Corynebacterium sp. sy017]|uniref:CAP domain-containing protein n=1 Tax=unclassified Corynebacterium TaxID=2624378 RepID=UPI001184EE9C|nr:MULTISPECIES: CAP domain-containing protein [unclassified Corynebacterium]MBP3088356.1 CAP domain-containing protein [Corynebacterium sp. sy017]QDZ41806.1 CAP domain-containing protein [Corynebacterium sp. sy039]TSD91672.1 CAP domain-containing protein [Corynebacterium sp. SY003]
MRFVKKTVMACTAFAIATTGLVAQPASAAPISQETLDSLVKSLAVPGGVLNPVERQRLVADTNAFRVQNGKRPLAVSPDLSIGAQLWAEYMAKTGQFMHYPFGNGRFGENIWMAKGVSYTEAVPGWINSPGHRQNMLTDSYTKIGIGVAYAPDGTVYAVQRFKR